MAQPASLTDQTILATDPQAMALSRQQQIADLLTQNSMQQPTGNIISGRYVAPSWAQQLQPLFNAAAGAYLSHNAENKQQALAEALRNKKSEEQQNIIDAINNGDQKTALSLASQAQYGGKEFLPALITSAIPKTPEKVAEYNVAKQQGFQGSFNDWANQITPAEQQRLAFEKQRLGLEQARFAREATNAPISPQENQLRTSFLNQAQPHIQISQAYRKIVSAPETAAGDMSRIFGYMKILDPGSTVREGEYASAENARGVPASVMAQYNRVLNGQRLTPQQRNEFTQSAGDLVNSQKQQFADVAKYYGDISSRYGVNPQNIIYDPYQGLDLKTTPPKTPKGQVNPAQQLNIPQNGGWNIISVTK